MIDDETIIEQLFARNEKGLEAMREKYRAACMAVARDVTGDEMDAEECVNDTWLKAWNSIPPDRPRSLKRYLLCITRNLSINAWHKKRAERRGGETGHILAELDETVIPAEDDPASDSTLSEALDTFIAGLERDERVPFVLRYWHGKPVGEIAHALGMPANTVTVRLKRTRAKLKTYLEKRGIRV